MFFVMINYYDCHCHLNSEKMFDNRKDYMKRFVKSGGRGIINSAADEFYNIKTIEISKACEDIYGNDVCVKSTLGWHPLEVVEKNIDQKNIDSKINRLKNFIIENKKYVVAVWESWIDLHYQSNSQILDLQKQLFVKQCELARKFDLPLVIHSRDGFEATIDILKNFTDLVVYFHCRWYWPEQLKILQKLKFKKLFIGFTGNITYKKVDDLFASLKAVPIDSLLLETDAPYLTPQVVRWQINEPSFVVYVYDFVSDFCDIQKEQLAAQIERNFLELIKW